MTASLPRRWSYPGRKREALATFAWSDPTVSDASRSIAAALVFASAGLSFF
eukprot:CAMPEP_0173396804 /NCGR_PEP_ID=MMETSP1356-20130122/36576_1 /TAXON_ID=77927 ORGANISM="Hemiselmis virescens, Strain PCC157" /NCGR_SAMPLE_ID=MMETSP1356 /ASSEMBLY_ACC=CAM_ASM_000847 /LENGTH=50 /DNA_ID=CAMNT_0014355913 /DNA_START=519 /DNA_END=668 /DNA_ORIENTATION=+